MSAMGQLDDYIARRFRDALHPQGCQCDDCWCCICGADLARFPEPADVEHVCPPSPVEPMGIMEFLALADPDDWPPEPAGPRLQPWSIYARRHPCPRAHPPTAKPGIPVLPLPPGNDPTTPQYPQRINAHHDRMDM